MQRARGLGNGLTPSAFGGCVGAGGFHSVATLIGLSELLERHAGPPHVAIYLAAMRAMRDTARPAPVRVHAGCASRAPVPRHSRITSHNRTWARCTPQPSRSFLRRTPGGLCSLLTILIAIMQVARVAKAMGMDVIAYAAPAIPTRRYRVPGIVGLEKESSHEF